MTSKTCTKAERVFRSGDADRREPTLSQGGKDAHSCVWIRRKFVLMRKKAAVHISERPSVAGETAGPQAERQQKKHPAV